MINGLSSVIFFLSLLNSLSLLFVGLSNIEQYPSDIEGTNWSMILSYIEIGVATSTILVSTSVFGMEICNPVIKNKRPIKVSTIIFSVMFVINVIISVYRLSETGLILESGLCKRLEGNLVCPTVLFRSRYDISDVEECKFNSFAESPNAWLSSGSNVIDWSNKSVYNDKDLLYKAYKHVRPNGDITKADDMVTYSDCYYWGCDPVCNDRHDNNEFQAWSSLTSSILFFVIIVFSLFQTNVRYEKLVQTDDSTPDEEAPEEEAPDASDDEDNKDSFSGSNSWNFKLRM